MRTLSKWQYHFYRLNFYFLTRLDGAVGAVGSCDAILCPQGFFAVDGRQITIEHPCLRCESLRVSPFLGQSSCSDISERNILQDLFSATRGTKWVNGDHWNSDAPLCSWYGIACGGTVQDDDGVTSIRLESNNMKGTLPATVWLLPSLVEVDLSGNTELHVSFANKTRSIPLVENINVASTIIWSVDGVSQASNLKRLSVSGITGKSPRVLIYLSIRGC